MSDEVLDESGAAAAEASSTKALAAKMAAAVATAMEKAPQTTEAAAEAPKVEAETPPPAAEAATEVSEQEETPPANFTELEKVLQEAGIDVGLTAADVPNELHPAYERMIRSVIDFAERGLSEHMEATKAMQQVEEFKQRLESSPDRILLALAVSRPDVFRKAVEAFQAMEQDENQKNLVIRELETEAKYQEALRKEQLFNERDRRIKAQQVIAATRRASRQHNVEYALAEKVVALAVQANKGDLDVSDVDGLVAELRPIKKPVIVKPKVVSPAKQAEVQKTPTTEVAASKPSPGLEDTTNKRPMGGGKFRNLIGDAVARLTGGNKQ